MALGPLVAAVAAVLCPGQVAFVDLTGAEVVRRVALPLDGAALFAAPDGRVVVPARDADATVVVSAGGRVERWKGRLYPLFFDQPDRLHTLLPGALATLSYPERLPLARIDLAGIDGARRAAVSSDGRLVAIVPSPSQPASVVLVAALEGGGARAVALGADAARLAIAPDGAFAIVATAAGRLEIASPGEPRGRDTGVGFAEVRALAWDGAGRDLLAAVVDGAGGALVRLKVDPRGKRPLRERFRAALPAPPLALAAVGDAIAVLGGGRLVILAKRGREVGKSADVAGGFDLVALPERPASTLPRWSDAPPQ